ncbi:MAG: WecB/TagA/CpsF family glycosyltransferase [Deinococcus sp.]|nr:WecB/TagA/CpsF family glycosyltransferase [Deinococcus sp.]
MPRVQVLGYNVDVLTMAQAVARCQALLARRQPAYVVTLNPEIVVQAQADREVHQAILDADLVTADGVGILWAAARSGHKLPERVSGVDLVMTLLAKGGERLRVYFLGGKPGVAQAAGERCAERHRTVVAGYHHGYFSDDAPVVADIVRCAPDLLLVGLGPHQEKWIHRHLAELQVPLSIGAGGTVDVLSGQAKLMPEWSRQLGLEWLLRVGSQPKRWRRFPRLLAFVRLVLWQRRV